MLRDTDAASAAENRTIIVTDTRTRPSGSPTQTPSGVRKRARFGATPTVLPPASEPIAVSEQAQRESGASDGATAMTVPPHSQPIPSDESQADAQLAILHANPDARLPTAQPISPTERKARKRGANAPPMPTLEAPPASPIGSNADGDGQPHPDTQPRHAIAATVNALVALQRQRRFCIVSQSRADRSMESLIALTIGFDIDASEESRKKVYAQAKAIRLAVEKGADIEHLDGYSEAIAGLVPFILTSAAARSMWDERRDEAESKMRKLVRTLPVYSWAQSVKGFGDLGLGIIVAEAGIPIGEYRTVSGLWKRMGLAVIDGERQRRKTGKEDALRHGYSPVRRAEIWSLCSDAMFRHQWRAAKEDAPAGPAGPYGEIYAHRRAVTDPRIEATEDLPTHIGTGANKRLNPEKWTKGRCHNDARRIMTKELLKDLWVQWRKSSPA